MAHNPEKNQKIFMWGYAARGAGVGGKGVGRARIDPRQVALKLQSKSITAHNRYYVK